MRLYFWWWGITNEMAGDFCTPSLASDVFSTWLIFWMTFDFLLWDSHHLVGIYLQVSLISPWTPLSLLLFLPNLLPFVTSKLLGSLITCSTCISACADGALWQMAIDLLQEVEVCNPWRRLTDGVAMGEALGVFLCGVYEQNSFFRSFFKGIQ